MPTHPLQTLIDWLEGLSDPIKTFILQDVYAFGCAIWPDEVEDHTHVLAHLKTIQGEWEIAGMTLVARELVSFALFSKTGAETERMQERWDKDHPEHPMFPAKNWETTVADWQEIYTTTLSHKAIHRWHTLAFINRSRVSRW